MDQLRSSLPSGQSGTNNQTGNTNNLIYNLPENSNTRSMCSITADQESHRFVVGTCSVSKQNELHVLNYSEETNRVDLETLLMFDGGEFWDLKASPYDREILACSSLANQDGRASVSLVRLPSNNEAIPEEGEVAKAQADVIGTFYSDANDINDYSYDDPLISLQWEDQEVQEGKTPAELLACNSQSLYVWDIQQGQLKEAIKLSEVGGLQSPSNRCKSVKRDPHNSNLLAYSYGQRFDLLDFRAPGARTSTIKDSQSLHATQTILDLDYNPIKVNTLATVGQDSTIRFWDLRKIESGQPVHSYNPTDMMSNTARSQQESKLSVTNSNNNSATVSGVGAGGSMAQPSQQYQCHWINKIKYNQSHDQLVLTCDSATFMNLFKFSSVSSAPQIQMTKSLFGLAGEEDSPTKDDDPLAFESGYQGPADEPDGESEDLLIQRNELEDSVLAIDWSAGDAWTFAGVSYNGTFFLNTVPSKTKYEILI